LQINNPNIKNFSIIIEIAFIKCNKNETAITFQKMKSRFISDLRFKVNLPLAFSLLDYKHIPDMETCVHSAIYEDPLRLNEEFMTLKDNHLLKIFWKDNIDVFLFFYFIDGVLVHQYMDEFIYRNPAIVEILRTVDFKYKFYCWSYDSGKRMEFKRIREQRLITKNPLSSF